MLDFLKAWAGKIVADGVEYASYRDVPANVKTIVLSQSVQQIQKTEHEHTAVSPVEKRGLYRIKVKSYMTKPATPDFDFMQKWNNNKPMPLRVMVGEKVKETRGMVYMILHGEILEERTQFCMKCGKPITNPVSQFFGMGPECGGHNYVNPFDSEEELKAAVESYKKQLKELVFEGWIIKSAIEEMEEI